VTDYSSGAAKVPAFRIDGDRRDLRPDAFRGLALWFIFLDHIPDDILAWLTLRNYGFSDTTEVFVFVGHVILVEFSGTIAMQVAVSIAGIVLMSVVATLMTWEAKLDRRGPKLF